MLQAWCNSVAQCTSPAGVPRQRAGSSPQPFGGCISSLAPQGQGRSLISARATAKHSLGQSLSDCVACGGNSHSIRVNGCARSFIATASASTDSTPGGDSPGASTRNTSMFNPSISRRAAPRGASPFPAPLLFRRRRTHVSLSVGAALRAASGMWFACNTDHGSFLAFLHAGNSILVKSVVSEAGSY